MWEWQRRVFLFFLNCYLAVPQPTLGHSQGDSLTNLMLITAFVQLQPKGNWEPRNEVGSLSPAECLVGFEPGTFWFWLQHLNPLDHRELKYYLFSNSLTFSNLIFNRVSVGLCFTDYIISISILCVPMEEPSFIESNQQICDFYKSAEFKKQRH